MNSQMLETGALAAESALKTTPGARGGSRIYKSGGLTQGTNLLGRHAETRGVWGHAPQEKFEI